MTKRNRDSTHIMMSADIEPSEENKEILQNVARGFLRREFFDKGYSFVFVVHNDTQHPHIHAVIKNKPIRMEIKPGVWKRRKLELNPNDLLHLREQFAIEMEKYGLKQVVTLRKDNPHKHLEDIEKRIFGDAEYGYKGVKEKINWYRSKLEEKDWKFEDKNIRQYSAYLQMELMKIKDKIKKSNISRKDKTKLNLEHRELMKTLDLARRDKESEQLKHMVQNFKDKTLESIENFQKRNITISELIDKNIESYEEVKKEAGLRVEERLLKIKEKLTGDYPSLSVKDAEYLGIDTSNLTTFSKRIEYKEKVLVSDVEDSKEIYEEIDKSYDADFIDLKSLDLSNININQETSKLKEEILVRQKTNLISKSIEPLKEYLKQNKSDLTENKYKFLENRLIEIKDKLTGDFSSLS
ncbi:relaxase/mobilization nuclease domain-containing protein, partial [Arcobacter porcinus]|uniref:relaxase/mobilization nuclease domain-containing protein n=1 Tax=Arcobacter porcinus TaxID=1935204 RepID=UPI00211D29F0